MKLLDNPKFSKGKDLVRERLNVLPFLGRWNAFLKTMYILQSAFQQTENWTLIVQAFEQRYIVFCGSELCFFMLIKISAKFETSCL